MVFPLFYEAVIRASVAPSVAALSELLAQDLSLINSLFSWA